MLDVYRLKTHIKFGITSFESHRSKTVKAIRLHSMKIRRKCGNQLSKEEVILKNEKFSFWKMYEEDLNQNHLEGKSHRYE